MNLVYFPGKVEGLFNEQFLISGEGQVVAKWIGSFISGRPSDFQINLVYFSEKVEGMLNEQCLLSGEGQVVVKWTLSLVRGMSAGYTAAKSYFSENITYIPPMPIQPSPNLPLTNALTGWVISYILYVSLLILKSLLFVSLLFINSLFINSFHKK